MRHTNVHEDCVILYKITHAWKHTLYTQNILEDEPYVPCPPVEFLQPPMQPTNTKITIFQAHIPQIEQYNIIVISVIYAPL